MVLAVGTAEMAAGMGEARLVASSHCLPTAGRGCVDSSAQEGMESLVLARQELMVRVQGRNRSTPTLTRWIPCNRRRGCEVPGNKTDNAMGLPHRLLWFDTIKKKPPQQGSMAADSEGGTP